MADAKKTKVLRVSSTELGVEVVTWLLEKDVTALPAILAKAANNKVNIRAYEFTATQLKSIKVKKIKDAKE